MHFLLCKNFHNVCYIKFTGMLIFDWEYSVQPRNSLVPATRCFGDNCWWVSVYRTIVHMQLQSLVYTQQQQVSRADVTVSRRQCEMVYHQKFSYYGYGKSSKTPAIVVMHHLYACRRWNRLSLTVRMRSVLPFYCARTIGGLCNQSDLLSINIVISATAIILISLSSWSSIRCRYVSWPV